MSAQDVLSQFGRELADIRRKMVVHSMLAALSLGFVILFSNGLGSTYASSFWGGSLLIFMLEVGFFVENLFKGLFIMMRSKNATESRSELD
ncbi:hypothetical protein V0242_24415 (plasmid) [Aeromonas hydrophila]|uniref:hypothetical protein n=1 Tax=Aeromonas hydrophila TaxID=644 RepID=UPI002ED00427|nr:hypothetical protein V0242_24415 [Aeromonas hydrophila]